MSQSNNDSPHAQYHKDAKIFHHLPTRLSVILKFSTNVDKILSCFNNSVYPLVFKALAVHLILRHLKCLHIRRIQ